MKTGRANGPKLKRTQLDLPDKTSINHTSVDRQTHTDRQPLFSGPE